MHLLESLGEVHVKSVQHQRMATVVKGSPVDLTGLQLDLTANVPKVGSQKEESSVLTWTNVGCFPTCVKVAPPVLTQRGRLSVSVLLDLNSIHQE